MLAAWVKFQNSPSCAEKIGNQCIWCNENITTPSGRTLLYPYLKQIGINCIKDIISNGKISQLIEKNGRNLTLIERMEVTSVIKCLPKSWRMKSFDLYEIDEFKKEQATNINRMNTKSVYKQKIKK